MAVDRAWRGIANDRVRALLGGALGLAALACGPAAEPAKPAPPAKLERAATESDLTTLTLTPEAVARLGIALAPVELRRVDRFQHFGGDVILPAHAVAAGRVPHGGQSVVSLVPTLAPTDMIRLAESQIDADAQLERARVQREAARIALQRARTLERDRAGSGRAADEAQAQLGIAEADLRAAQARRDLLGPRVLDASPVKRLWIRVPVYVGDLPEIDARADAEVVALGARAGGDAAKPRAAKPVAAPPSANPAAASVDLFYELANDDGLLRPGERIAVSLRLRGDAESLVVPWSAVLYDIHGGNWVYEATAPNVFVRRRVRMRAVSGADAVLESGPAPGVQVVSQGAAELFGTEFGVGK